MCNAMLNSDFMPYNRYLWKIKIPLKVKVFLWFLYKGVTLTKDNLIKRSWHGNEKCYFCNNLETIQYLFLNCVLGKFINYKRDILDL